MRSHEKGQLRCQKIKGEAYLDLLGKVDSNGDWQIKDCYKGLPYANAERLKAIMQGQKKERWGKLYATGLDRGNSSIGYVAISTLFMREHNQICEALQSRNPSWHDEQLFQTARLVNMALLMKLVVVDYINHIAGVDLFSFDTMFAEKQEWYRTPWIALEFDMLYRWHGLIPDSIVVEGKKVPQSDYRFNNDLLEKVGFSQVITAASESPAGKIGLKNVPDFMAMAEYRMIKMGRDFRLASFNDYRVQFGLKRLTSFAELTENAELHKELKSIYNDINKVELIVGLFAEKHSENRLYGSLMYTMVAYDAFTQIYTNPLLSKNVYNAETMTQYGLDLIEETNSIQELVNRNIPRGTNAMAYFSQKP